MKRNHVVLLGATVAASTLALSGCSGDSGASPDGKINGAHKEDTSASATASPTAGAGRPGLSLPKDVTLDFDFDAPSDKGEAAAQNDAANFVRSIMHGITQQDTNDPAHRFYSQDSARNYAHGQIKASVDQDLTVSGKNHFYAPKVTSSEDTKGKTVSFCTTQREFYSKDVKTHKRKVTKESIDDYGKYVIYMVPKSGHKGVWSAQWARVDQGNKECQQTWK